MILSWCRSWGKVRACMARLWWRVEAPWTSQRSMRVSVRRSGFVVCLSVSSLSKAASQLSIKYGPATTWIRTRRSTKGLRPGAATQCRTALTSISAALSIYNKTTANARRILRNCQPGAKQKQRFAIRVLSICLVMINSSRITPLSHSPPSYWPTWRIGLVFSLAGMPARWL